MFGASIYKLFLLTAIFFLTFLWFVDSRQITKNTIDLREMNEELSIIQNENMGLKREIKAIQERIKWTHGRR